MACQVLAKKYNQIGSKVPSVLEITRPESRKLENEHSDLFSYRFAWFEERGLRVSPARYQIGQGVFDGDIIDDFRSETKKPRYLIRKIPEILATRQMAIHANRFEDFGAFGEGPMKTPLPARSPALPLTSSRAAGMRQRIGSKRRDDGEIYESRLPRHESLLCSKEQCRDISAIGSGYGTKVKLLDRLTDQTQKGDAFQFLARWWRLSRCDYTVRVQQTEANGVVRYRQNSHRSLSFRCVAPMDAALLVAAL